jgi:hypothetical protein
VGQAGEYGVGSVDGRRECGVSRGVEVGGDGAHGGRGQLGRIADDRGDVVSGVECLGDELAADASGGGEDGELHEAAHSPRWR